MARIVRHESERVLLDHALQEITGRVERWPDRRVFLIVPESSKADVERRYLERFSSEGLLMAEVLSIKRLAFRIFAEVGGLGVKRLTGTGRAVLIGKLLLSAEARFQRFGKLRRKPGFSAQLSTLWEEFSRFMVDADDLSEAAKKEAEERARARFEDLATLYKLVEEARAASGFVDSATDNERLIECLKTNKSERLDFLAHTSVYVTGFGELTPFSASEIAILKALNERVGQLTILLPQGEGAAFSHARRSCERLIAALPTEVVSLDRPVSPPAKEKYLIYADSVEEEARFVAGEIRRLLVETDVERRDIAVGLSDPEESSILADTLRAFGVPTFMDEASHVKWTPFARLMDAVLKISQRQDDLDEIMRLLQNPLSGLDREVTDRFENFCLARGLKRLASILNTSRQIDEAQDRDVYAQCLPLLQIVYQLGVDLRQTRGGVSKVMLLQAFLRDLPGLFDRLESDIEQDFDEQNTLQATAMARAVNEWQEKLAEAAQILGEETLSQAHFCRLLSESIFRLEVKQIPVGIDRVRVAPLRQIVHYPAKVLFVTGVSSETYPLRESGSSFLTVEERKHLADIVSGFPNGSEDLRLSAAALDRKLRALPERSLYVLTPQGEGATLPAMLDLADGWRAFILREDVPGMHWNHPAEMKRRVPRLSKEALHREDVALWLCGFEAAGHKLEIISTEDHFLVPEALVLAKGTLEKALERCSIASVSSLQQFNVCPYQFFADVLLGLQERDLGVPDAAVQGEFLHNVLHQSLLQLMQSLAGIPEKDRAKTVLSWQQMLASGGQKTIESQMMESGRARSLSFAGNDVRVVSRLSPAIKENIDRIARLYVARGARPIALEYRFSKDAPEAVSVMVGDRLYRFSGVIDRIDRYPDQRDVLVDYKRGAHPFKKEDFEAGVDIQLPLYENAWTRLNPSHKVLGFYYQTLRPYTRDTGYEPPVLEPERHLLEVDKRMQTDEKMAERALDIAADTLQRIESGAMPAAPYVPRKNSEPCRYCAFRVACKLDPLSDRIERALERRDRA